MKIVNLTPEELHLYDREGNVRVIPPTKPSATLTVTLHYLPDVEGLPVVYYTDGFVRGLPQTTDPDTIYVISAEVARAAARGDVYSPGPRVIDADGNTKGYFGLHASTM